MYDAYEYEYIFEEMMDAGLGYSLFTNFGSGVLGLVGYVLTALALYTLAQRRGIKNAWLSWVPVVNCWIVGSLSDQYRYVVKGEVKNKRKTLLILNIITWIISVVMIVILVIMMVNVAGFAMAGSGEEELMEAVFGPMFGILGLCLPLVGVSIATAVVRYMAMYDIYTSCTPKNNVIFLVLSIFISITEPFFLFFTRKRDDGMPPRKQEPAYEPPQEPAYEPPQEPAYEPPREPWNNPEYL